MYNIEHAQKILRAHRENRFEHGILAQNGRINNLFYIKLLKY